MKPDISGVTVEAQQEEDLAYQRMTKNILSSLCKTLRVTLSPIAVSARVHDSPELLL